jgi:HSP20 family protein
MPMPDRDLFASFDRMRREMDEMFGDAFGRSGLSRRRTGHWPPVDVAYASDPPRAIVTAELAGMESSDIALQIEGRRLILAGHRRGASLEGEVYQQVEIERGVFRRIVELGAEVDADAASARYENGMLRIELPLRPRSAAPHEVPIESGEVRRDQIGGGGR